MYYYKFYNYYSASADMASTVVYQVVGFFDVAARLCAGDGPIAELVGGSTYSVGRPIVLRCPFSL